MFRDSILHVDLDNTLRAGSHPGSPFFPLAAPVVNALRARGCRVLIVTNNSCQAPGEIAAGLAAAGFELGEEDVVTPLVAAREFFDEVGGVPFVVGPPAVRAYLARPGTPTCVFLASRFHMALAESAGAQSLVEVCRVLRECRRRDPRGDVLHVAETPTACSVRDCGDTAAPAADADTLLPDLGAYARMLAEACEAGGAPIEPYEHGKPGRNIGTTAQRRTRTCDITDWRFFMEPSLMGVMGLGWDASAGNADPFCVPAQHRPTFVLGDGDSDRAFAENQGCPFVGINYREGATRFYSERDLCEKEYGTPYIPSSLEALAALLGVAPLVAGNGDGA
jgi:ribonucleotide monophosphatase NagD (HAD superfamily)